MRKTPETTIDIFSDEDYLRCMEYIITCEIGNPEIVDVKDYAAMKGVHYQTLWEWRNKWRKSGLDRLVREELGTSIYSAYVSISRKAMRVWPMILDEWIDLALRAKSEFNRIQAITSLYDKVIKPAIEETERPGDDERSYLNSLKSGMTLDPMAVAQSSGRQRSRAPSDLADTAQATDDPGVLEPDPSAAETTESLDSQEDDTAPGKSESS